MNIVHYSETEILTKLYPGADSTDRDIIDFLQVVLHITLCHSVIKKG